MKDEKFLRYDLIDGQYWKIVENSEITPGEEKSIFISKSVGILYDHKIGETVYHGLPDEVKAKIKELTESQKKAEDDLGFFLNDYKYYEFDDINIDTLNKIILQKGYMTNELK